MKHEVIQTSAADTCPPFEPATFWSQFRRGTAMVKACACILWKAERRVDAAAARMAAELVRVAICDAVVVSPRLTPSCARARYH